MIVLSLTLIGSVAQCQCLHRSLENLLNGLAGDGNRAMGLADGVATVAAAPMAIVDPYKYFDKTLRSFRQVLQ